MKKYDDEPHTSGLNLQAEEEKKVYLSGYVKSACIHLQVHL